MPAQQNTYARAREAFRAQAFGGTFGGMTPAKNQGTGKPLTGNQALASLQKGSQLAAGGNGPLGYEAGDREVWGRNSNGYQRRWTRSRGYD